jgi:hypothetical protein
LKAKLIRYEKTETELRCISKVDFSLANARMKRRLFEGSFPPDKCVISSN